MKRLNEHHIADVTFKLIFLNENGRILIQISLESVLKGSTDNKSALVQIMAWYWAGDNRPFATIPRIQFCASFWGWRESWSSTDAGKATWIIMAMHVFKACVHHRLNWVLSPYTYGFS